MQTQALCPGWLAMAIAIVSCAHPSLPSAAPSRGRAVDAPQEPAVPAPLRLALQTLPARATARWGGGGQAIALLAPACDLALIDIAHSVVTARMSACSVWPSPTDDTFLVRTNDGVLGVWGGDGTRRALLAGDDRVSEAPQWSPDGKHVAVLLPRGVTLQDPHGVPALVNLVLEGDAGTLRWAGREGSFRADGEQLIVSDGERLLLGDLRGTGTLTPMQTGCGRVHEARFSPRGDTLAVECADGHAAEIWDTRSLRRIATMAHFAAWEPSSQRVIGLDGNHLDVHDASTGQRALRVEAHSWDAFAVSPDGARLAVEVSGGSRRSLAVFDIAGGREIARLPDRVAPTFSPDGRYLATAGASTGHTDLVAFETGTWREVWRSDETSNLAWSLRGSMLAVTGSTPTLRLEDLAGGSARTIEGAFTLPVTETSVDDAGHLVALLTDGGACSAVRLDSQGMPSPAPSACIDRSEPASPDGQKRLRFSRSASSGLSPGDWALFADDADTGEHVFVDHGWSMSPQLVWSRRGHRLLVVQGRGLLFDVDERRAWAVRVTGSIRAAALDEEGTRIALSMDDGSVVVAWPRSHRALLQLQPGSREQDPAVVLAFEGERVAAASSRGEVSVYDATTGSRVANWRARFVPGHMTLTADGRFLALTSGDQLDIARIDGSGVLTVTALSSGQDSSLLVRDATGFVDGSPAALARVRWQSTPVVGEARWLDAAGLDATPLVSPLRPGLLASLLAAP